MSEPRADVVEAIAMAHARYSDPARWQQQPLWWRNERCHEVKKMLGHIRAAGFRVVPAEPTEAMHLAATEVMQAARAELRGADGLRLVWPAMLAAFDAEQERE